MAFDRFMVAPINSGLQTNLKSWLIPDDAFEYLKNAYIFRGRVRKRFGSVLMGTSQLQSRLRINIGTTDGSGNLAFTSLPGAVLNEGAMFSCGSIMFQVTDVPTIVGNDTTLSTDLGPGGPAVGTVRLNSTGPNVYQFRITGGQTAIANTIVYWYPALPVTGIWQYLSGATNNHPTYAFDTQFAYVFTPGVGWNRSGTALWHGDETQLFWATNWTVPNTNTLLMFVSNFNYTLGAGQPTAADDPIWYFDGTNWVDLPGTLASTRGIFFLPGGAAPYTGPFVQTARIIVPFKNRLVLLNTIENNNTSATGTGTATQFQQRARWSFYGSPLAVNAWYETNQQDNAGNIGAGAGYADAATEEQIISAGFIKDRLIVYFERSTWELVYTGNQVQPFYWQKLNTELGSMSTFSDVPFDKETIAIGQTGVHACNGSNVVRIDDKIPDEIFDFETKNNGALRTVGIRDYYTETAFWTFMGDPVQSTQNFPNQMLIYNYKNGSWALNDDCFTFFGYFEQQSDITWASSIPTTWYQANFTWDSGSIQANNRQILGGTPEGFVLIIEPEVARNAPGMSITDITFNGDGTLDLTIYNHNLTSQPNEYPDSMDFILLENIVGDAGTMAALNYHIFQVDTVVDADTIRIDTNDQVPLLAGDYDGGGTAARVSNIQITTKRFNPYVDSDRNFYIMKIDFGVRKTASGEITIDYYPSSTNLSMTEGASQAGALVGLPVLQTSPYDANYYPLEQYQELLWHPMYFQVSAQYIQFGLYFTGFQMILPAVSLSEFVLEGFVIYCTPTDSRLQ